MDNTSAFEAVDPGSIPGEGTRRWQAGNGGLLRQRADPPGEAEKPLMGVRFPLEALNGVESHLRRGESRGSPPYRRP